MSPQLLNDILAGKRVEVKVGEGAFWRTFGGDQSPEDLETALQLVYRLFTSTVVADPVKLATCIRCVRQRGDSGTSLMSGKVPLAVLRACSRPLSLSCGSCRQSLSITKSPS